jgi:hypothetical protein
MKVVSVLAALACCATTLTLAFGHALSAMAARAAASFTALAASPPLDGFDLPGALALLGAFVVFSSSALSSKDM